jgi:enediyne biosynthesis protein E4
VCGLTACSRESHSPPLFELLKPEATGVSFANTLPERADFNPLNYLYYYNGGGVAVGDIDGDGLPDLYFTANLGPNRLYRNRGNYTFEDVTDKAGVADPDGWKTGVTMADVNGDGRIDIYVSGVDYLTMHGRNVLYINNGDGTFTDRTKEFGLEHVGYSTQALFFDYDGDGDLDMYLLDHSTHTERTIGAQAQGGAPNPRTSDRLFRNDGGHFTDVTAQAGLRDGIDGYGLGVVASDFNDDGCPDIYVTNDFQGNDYLYLNNCNGTFTESITKAMGHTSMFSMGVDAADFNNDGRTDIISLDMLPEREDILKTSASTESFNIYNLRLQAGYQPQYARNALQLNRGNGRFSEIGYLSGVSATDWSWSALFADLDNDGKKDLFVTNGIFRRPNDMDYISFVGNEAVQATLHDTITRANLGLLQKMPQISLANYAFRNSGNLKFTNMAEAWGLAQPGFSNGAAYVDLTNSGNLDLVVNNINAPASIYRSHARAINGNHYLTVQLNGSGLNTAGIGARVEITQKGEKQVVEQMPTRGFLSSVDPRLHFGLGSSSRIDTLTVIWPNHRFQTLTNVQGDTILTLAQKDASQKYQYRAPASAPPMFTDVTAKSGVDFKHEEDTFYDYSREPLMPHLLSTEGPRLAVADVNGDGLDDFYVGGAKWQPGRLFIQQRDGTFRASAQPAFVADSLSEDIGASFFDANGDGRQDLLVVSGGNEFWGEQDALRPRLYLNDGRGNFQRARGALPNIFENGSCVAVGDFNGDGYPDLFIGSRVVSKSYGIIPRSHLLENDGTGRFTDVTLEKAPGLSEAGMVSSAVWIDYDHDGKLDLVVVGEWMPVRVFHQENGKLVDRTKEAGLSGTNGWWNSVEAVDLRGTGRRDLVLGNLGLNSYLRASPKEPTRLYVNDFSHSGGGNLEQILTTYKNGVSYPVAGRDELLKKIPSLRSKYPSYKDFGASRIEDIFPAGDISQAQVREAYTFASAVALNNGNGTFTLQPLPVEAQFAPIYASLAGDFDGDGKTDLLVGGNLYGVTPTLGRYDASYGLMLRGDGKGGFTAVDMAESNLVLDGQVRDMKMLRGPKGERLIVVARNNDRVMVLRQATRK